MRDLLVAMAERSASDLHITSGAPPTLRVHGHLVPLEYPPLTPDQTKALAYSMITTEQRERFEANHELDFSYGITGLSRYRVNVYQQKNAVGIAIRSIPHQPKGFEELGLPVENCNQLISKHKGLILITGPTGHGKTTTMAAMIDRINRLRDVHIVTVEDPLEYLYEHQKALVNQREVGQDTHSFPAALKYVLRQDPDVVLIGEMRDLETIQAALTIAETGHLTFATLHTNSCAQSIDRVIDVFPPHQQSRCAPSSPWCWRQCSTSS
jgi:twitching motility protein PilT